MEKDNEPIKMGKELAKAIENIMEKYHDVGGKSTDVMMFVCLSTIASIIAQSSHSEEEILDKVNIVKSKILDSSLSILDFITTGENLCNENYNEFINRKRNERS